jgi:hypothetical protein
MPIHETTKKFLEIMHFFPRSLFFSKMHAHVFFNFTKYTPFVTTILHCEIEFIFCHEK